MCGGHTGQHHMGGGLDKVAHHQGKHRWETYQATLCWGQ